MDDEPSSSSMHRSSSFTGWGELPRAARHFLEMAKSINNAVIESGFRTAAGSSIFSPEKNASIFGKYAFNPLQKLLNVI